MLVFLLVCLPTTVYCMLSCRQSCEACMDPSSDNPPEVQRVYCSMCLECKGPRSRFEANMMLQETQFEAPAAEANDEILDGGTGQGPQIDQGQGSQVDQGQGPQVDQGQGPQGTNEGPNDPDCPGGRCRTHSREGDYQDTASETPDDQGPPQETTRPTQCPTQNCQNKIPTICITIPPWACPTTTTPSTTTQCQTTCRSFTDCGGCGLRHAEPYRRQEEPPEVYVAFPKGMNTNGNFIYKKVKNNKRSPFPLR